MPDNQLDEFYMMEAIKEAKKAEKLTRVQNEEGGLLS